MQNIITSQAKELINLTKIKKTNSKTKIVAITSGKGGVGKSTFTANISYLLSKNKKIVIFDADIGLSNMHILLDIKPKYTLYDYLHNRSSLEDIILKTKYDNVMLVAGKSGHQYSLENISNQFQSLLIDIQKLDYYDYIYVDTGAGINTQVQEFLNVADEIIAITTPDPSALTDVYALIKMISQTKKRLFIIFNQTHNYKIGETINNSLVSLANKNRLNKNFMVKYVGNVTFDSSIVTTNRLKKLYVKELNDSISTKQMNVIVDKLKGYI